MELHTVLLIVIWFFYFLIHSLLASLWVKNNIEAQLPALFRYYRLFYNLLAILLLLPPLYFIYQIPSEMLWQWTGVWNYLADGMALLALMGFIWTLRYYNGMDFLGINALKQTQLASEYFRLSPLHAYVRHPWYSLAIVMIWTRDMNSHMLISANMITAYFFIGSYLEDLKLIKLYGEQYRKYRQAVPGIIPHPKRFLRQAQLNKFLDQ